MLPQTCLRNPLIPRAGVQTVESGAKWRAERKGNTRNSTSDNPIFQISSGEYPRFIFLLRFYLHRPRIYLNAWNKLLIGHTLWTFSWRDAWEIKAGSGHAEIYFYLRVAGNFISILGSCLQYVFWLMLKALARMRGVGRKNTKTSCCIDDYNLNVPKLKLEQVLKNGHPTGPIVQYRLKPADQCEPQVCHTSN